MNSFCRSVLLGFGFLLIGWMTPARAQLTLDGVTNVINGSASNINGSLIVGSNLANSLLVITNSGSLSNDLGYLGYNASSSNNVAVVTGVGSLWTNSSNLFVGFEGSRSHLVVSNGGTVSATNVTLGFSDLSTNNRITIAGGTLRVTNVSGTGTLDIRRGTNQFNSGLIEVDQLLMTNALVGAFEFNGGTLIARGGLVTNQLTFVVGAAGTNAAILDVRSNAPLELLNGLFVGANPAARSQLLITNGGTLRVTGSVRIGFGAGANSNVAWVTGTGSLWTNNSFFEVGYDGSGNQLIVSNGGVIGNATGFIGNSSVASNNVARVTGAGSRWVNTRSGIVGGGLTVGRYGSRNQLVVDDGGVVIGEQGYLGGFANANQNEVLVTGAGSLWTNSNWTYVGFSGSGNRLVVSNGGTVASRGGWIGFNAGANSNLAVVTGVGSLLSGLTVGESGSWNQLVVSNGGTANGGGRIGWNATASNNLAVVTGSGSLWTNSAQLWVGSLGSGNQLVVSNGGTVSSTNVVVGGGSTSTNNRLTVDGATLLVTSISGTGTLDIRRGTNVFNGGLIVADRLLLNNGSLSRFEFNGGTLKIDSATVSNGIPFTVGNGTSSATLDFTGSGTRTFGSGLVIRSNATVSFSAGVLNSSGITNRNGAAFIVGNATSNAALNLLGNGTHTFANNLIVSSNAQLTGNGTLLTTSVASFGTIAPGNSAGALNIATNLLLFDSAKLTFEIGGLIATNDYDRINVGSLLQMGGTLSLELINNFLPEPEHTFTLLTFGTQSGSFTNIMGGRVSLTNNLASFAVTQTATNLQLSGVTYVDTDGDGQGDLQELAAGTDPNASGSYLQITSLTRNGSGHYVIQFQSVLGKSYRIEWTDNFVTWNSVLSPVLTSPAPGVSQWIDDGTLTGGLPGSRTYRIGLQ